MNLLDYLPVVPNFPKPGIMFRDISPLLANPHAFQEAIKQLVILTQNVEYTHILGVESRGFIFGAALANHLAKPLVLARKPNKLPLEVHRESYGLEYGQDLLEIQKKIIPEGARVLIVDDVLATGGTFLAAANLVKKAQSEVVGAVSLLEITFLQGAKKLEAQNIISSSVLEI